MKKAMLGALGAMFVSGIALSTEATLQKTEAQQTAQLKELQRDTAKPTEAKVDQINVTNRNAQTLKTVTEKKPGLTEKTHVQPAKPGMSAIKAPASDRGTRGDAKGDANMADASGTTGLSISTHTIKAGKHNEDKPGESADAAGDTGQGTSTHTIKAGKHNEDKPGESADAAGDTGQGTSTHTLKGNARLTSGGQKDDGRSSGDGSHSVGRSGGSHGAGDSHGGGVGRFGGGSMSHGTCHRGGAGC